MPHRFQLHCLAILIALLAHSASAKRIAPADVAPVVQGTTEYRAPVTRPGCIEARDPKTDTAWWRQIYVLVYDPSLEKDVQDVFIKEIKAVEGGLQIVNERGDIYKLDLKTMAVEVVKGSLIVKKGQ